MNIPYCRWLISLIASCALANDIVITKDARPTNPTLYVAEFVGSVDARSRLDDALKFCGWFELVTQSTADYQLRIAMGADDTMTSVEARLRDSTGRELFAFRQSGVAGADSKALIYACVDEVIRRQFGRSGFCSSRLAYVKRLETVKEVWLADFDGGNPVRLTHNNHLSVEPAWSPSGDQLAYTRYSHDGTDIVLMDLVRQRHRLLVGYRGLNSGVAFSPDGRFVAMTLSKDGNVELYRMALSTGETVRLTTSEGNEASPCWSPDGRQICFVSDDRGRPRLFLTSYLGGTMKPLLNNTSESVSPDWSPVSNRICFAQRAGTRYVVAVVDMAARSRSVNVIVDAPGDWESPSWARDGRHIVCSRQHQGRQVLYLIDSVYGKFVPLKNFTGDDSLPVYSAVGPR